LTKGEKYWTIYTLGVITMKIIYTLYILFIFFSCTRNDKNIDHFSKYHEGRYFLDRYLDETDIYDNLQLFIELDEVSNNESIYIKSTLTNKSNYTDEIYLKEHFYADRTSAYLTQVYMEILNEHGTIIVRKLNSFRWWNTVALVKEPEERIVINPGEQFVKTFRLNDFVQYEPKEFIQYKLSDGKIYVKLLLITTDLKDKDIRRKYISNVLEINIE
jgi:hypothetical protein